MGQFQPDMGADSRLGSLHGWFTILVPTGFDYDSCHASSDEDGTHQFQLIRRAEKKGKQVPDF